MTSVNVLFIYSVAVFLRPMLLQCKCATVATDVLFVILAVVRNCLFINLYIVDLLLSVAYDILFMMKRLKTYFCTIFCAVVLAF